MLETTEGPGFRIVSLHIQKALPLALQYFQEYSLLFLVNLPTGKTRDCQAPSGQQCVSHL